MRHAIGWGDLRAKRVGIFGTGVEGRTALARVEPLAGSIVVVDDEARAPIDGHEVLVTSDGGLEALLGCDVVIKSPGISRYGTTVQALDDAGVPVVGGLGLELHDRDRARVVCITGTKGKSTTAAILGHLLAGLGRRVAVTGNIGVPPFDPSVPDDLDVLVIETSSFQALDVADAPGVVVVTSLDADHLDWHGSAAQYQADKLSLTSLPDAGITIAQGGSDALRAASASLGGEVRWVEGPAGSWSEPLGLVGEHNLANAELARQAIIALGIPEGTDEAALRHAAEGFAGLPGRFVEIASIDGVRFIDDSLATNVLPTLAALDALEQTRLAILVGGYDRGIDYEPLVAALAARPWPTLVVGLPASGAALIARIEEAGSTTETASAADVAEATSLASRWAAPDGVVLLSPAAPSFSQFRSWKERSDAFADAVAQLRTAR